MDTKTAFLIQYFRRELDSPSSGDGVDFYVFKDPVEQDLSETFQDEIVMKLPVPSFFYQRQNVFLQSFVWNRDCSLGR